jgi:hypothetical protein
MDSLALDGLGSGLVMLVRCSSGLGLPLSLSCFFPGAAAFHTIALNRNKDLQGDKKGCATRVAWKRDSYIV